MDKDTIRTNIRRIRKRLSELNQQNIGGEEARYLGLALAFLRERPYRGVEFKHHVQEIDGQRIEHNMPNSLAVAAVAHGDTGWPCSGSMDPKVVDTATDAERWLAVPAGAEIVDHHNRYRDQYIAAKKARHQAFLQRTSLACQ